ncbi:MAG: MinD/ParA family protein [Firmicutes bacterium]|nr:MinD/ParA family protein [Bacillota bacterium]
MKDQADRLRKIIDNLRMKQQYLQASDINEPVKKTARVITVTSGKGGVGKTNLAVNIAITLSELGLRVIIIDADLGLANVDVLLGLVPQYTLADALNNNKNIVEIMCEGPNGIKFISGGSGVEELIKLSKDKLNSFINNIGQLDRFSDIIIIDTGAGLSDNVIKFVMAADEIVLVTTPEPTSITDAYALIKLIVNRDKEKKIKIIVNRAESVKEGNDALRKLMLVSEKFLNAKLDPLGVILYDEAVVKAVKLQQPFSLSFPNSQASKFVRQVTGKLVNEESYFLEYKPKGIKSFVRRLAGFTSML